MNLLGTVITHSAFGKGTILEHTGNYLVISFAQGQKEFLYPNAFSKHISAVDPEIAALIKTEVAVYEASEVAILENKRQEMVAQQYRRREALQKAAAKKPAKKRVAKVATAAAEQTD
jgi:hypothetical protein